MRRREFVELLGGAAAATALPFAGRVQPCTRVRRISVAMPFVEDDPQAKARIGAFVEALQKLGWSEGRDVLLQSRWNLGTTDRAHKDATELVALAPDVILADG